MASESVSRFFEANEYWTNGPYYGTRGTFFADVDGDGRADAIVVNDDAVVVRRSAYVSEFVWTGTRRVAYILANVTNDPRFPAPPADRRAQVSSRVQDLQEYIRIVSIENAALEAQVFGPYTVQRGAMGAKTRQ